MWPSLMNTSSFLFEVMDKEPTLTDIWSTALMFGAGGFLLCWRRPLFLIPVFPMALLLVCGGLLELHDPDVSPGILREAWRGYFLQSYAALALTAALPVAGAAAGTWIRWMRETKYR